MRERLPAETYKKYSDKFEVEKLKNLDEVFQLNSIPNFFYVLVTGSVYILIKPSGTDEKNVGN
jgi:hypothetical protein